jgi:hypothetical protein
MIATETVPVTMLVEAQKVNNEVLTGVIVQRVDNLNRTFFNKNIHDSYICVTSNAVFSFVCFIKYSGSVEAQYRRALKKVTSDLGSNAKRVVLHVIGIDSVENVKNSILKSHGSKKVIQSYQKIQDKRTVSKSSRQPVSRRRA